ncbi:hypothetical protein Tco_0011563 [Tanacetum coccineum]
MAYLCLHFTKDHEGTRFNTPANPADIFTLVTNNSYKSSLIDEVCGQIMEKDVKKGAVEHIEYYLKIIDPIRLPNVDHDKLRIVVFPISLARDIFTKGALWDYWKMGGDEIEVSDDESSDLKEYWSDKEEETGEILKIETDVFYYETPLCLAFNEFNYLLKVDPDLLTKDIMGFKTYEDYKEDDIRNEQECTMGLYDKPMLIHGIIEGPKPVNILARPFNYKTRCTKGSQLLVGEWDGNYNEGNLLLVLPILETRSLQDLNLIMNQAMIVGKDGRAMRFTTTIMMKGNMKMKLMKKDMSYVVSKLTKCRFAKYKDTRGSNIRSMMKKNMLL